MCPDAYTAGELVDWLATQPRDAVLIPGQTSTIETNNPDDTPEDLERLFKEIYRGAWKQELDHAKQAEAQLRALKREPEPQPVDVEQLLAKHGLQGPHRPLEIFDGATSCLEDGQCAHEHGEADHLRRRGDGSGFCPHTRLAAVICPTCSDGDSITEAWPARGQVPWPCPHTGE